MKKEVCQKCKHFIQHYSYSNKFGVTKINCGHCYKRQMAKKECSMFEEKVQVNENEISIFDEIVKYKIILNSAISKIETMNSLLNNIEKDIQNQIK